MVRFGRLHGLVAILLSHHALGANTDLGRPFNASRRTPLHEFNKRHYGVSAPDSPKHPKPVAEFGPWPVTPFEGDEHRQPLRYCFEDERSAKTLQKVIDEAVVKWKPAMHPHTALTIALDNPDSPLCNWEKVRHDALVIFDATKDDDEDYNELECETDSIEIGYEYGNTGTTGRHRLEFCHLWPHAPVRTWHWAVRGMAHELGHVVGLAHEQQRPDTRQHLNFKCRNLEGYERGVKAALVDEKGMFPDDWEHDTEENVALKTKGICTEDAYAAAYLPAAVPFVLGDRMQHSKWKHYVWSEKFDLESIMIYDSTANAEKRDTAKGWVQWQKGNKQPVWQGGSLQPVDAKLSPGDVARVAQMYPLPNGGSKTLAASEEWQVARAD